MPFHNRPGRRPESAEIKMRITFCLRVLATDHCDFAAVPSRVLAEPSLALNFERNVDHPRRRTISDSYTVDCRRRKPRTSPSCGPPRVVIVDSSSLHRSPCLRNLHQIAKSTPTLFGGIRVRGEYDLYRTPHTPLETQAPGPAKDRGEDDGQSAGYNVLVASSNLVSAVLCIKELVFFGFFITLLASGLRLRLRAARPVHGTGRKTAVIFS
ncbi:hypothetical protein K438DRAFT_2019431 [Mycena galopus ATCC 62051]|nr:hypothetical protein K438DRAFT_2019431 [Mycena galopus ATCC 62051]